MLCGVFGAGVAGAVAPSPGTSVRRCQHRAVAAARTHGEASKGPTARGGPPRCVQVSRDTEHALPELAAPLRKVHPLA
jgi:hypothetical protein